MTEEFARLTQLLHHNPGASEEEIGDAERALDVAFPRVYREFLAYSNGAEGPIGSEHYLVLWSTKELVRINESYEMQTELPGIVLFGSDGGDRAYAFDYRLPTPGVTTLSLLLLNFDEVTTVYPDFTSFLERLNEDTDL